MLYFHVRQPDEHHQSPFARARACGGPLAEVAELADALASGASGRKAIGVRVPASAPAFAGFGYGASRGRPSRRTGAAAKADDYHHLQSVTVLKAVASLPIHRR